MWALNWPPNFYYLYIDVFLFYFFFDRGKYQELAWVPNRARVVQSPLCVSLQVGNADIFNLYICKWQLQSIHTISSSFHTFMTH